jgi:hypothetical protein
MPHSAPIAERPLRGPGYGELMPPEPAENRRRGNVAAQYDIRRAEARRLLGMLDSSELPERARGWLADGAESSNVRALAGIEALADGVSQALVGEIAAEFGLGFASLQEARRFQSEEVIRARGFGADVSAQIYTLSNGLTDEVVGRLRSFVAKLIHR